MRGRTKGKSRSICEEEGLQPGESEQALSHHLGSLSTMGRTVFVSIMAEHEDIEAALRDDRPPRDPPDLSDYQASDMQTPTRYAGAMASGQAPIWCDPMSRELLGLLDADTFAAVRNINQSTTSSTQSGCSA